MGDTCTRPLVFFGSLVLLSFWFHAHTILLKKVGIGTTQIDVNIVSRRVLFSGWALYICCPDRLLAWEIMSLVFVRINSASLAAANCKASRMQTTSAVRPLNGHLLSGTSCSCLSRLPSRHGQAGRGSVRMGCSYAEVVNREGRLGT